MDAQYDGVTTDDNGSMVNNKPFQTVIKPRRRRHERAVFGNGSDDVITSGLQKHELFVFQVNKSTTDVEVKSFLERKKVHVVNIKRVSAEESASNSYHVILHCRDVRTIINSDFWYVVLDAGGFTRVDRAVHNLHNNSYKNEYYAIQL